MLYQGGTTRTALDGRPPAVVSHRSIQPENSLQLFSALPYLSLIPVDTQLTYPSIGWTPYIAVEVIYSGMYGLTIGSAVAARSVGNGHPVGGS